jgi:hypothetical protein
MLITDFIFKTPEPAPEFTFGDFILNEPPAWEKPLTRDVEFYRKYFPGFSDIEYYAMELSSKGYKYKQIKQELKKLKKRVQIITKPTILTF